MPTCTNASATSDVGTVCDTQGTRAHVDLFPGNTNSCFDKMVEVCEIQRAVGVPPTSPRASTTSHPPPQPPREQAQLPLSIIAFLLWAASGALTTYLTTSATEFRPIVAIPGGIPMQGQPMMAQPVVGAVVGSLAASAEPESLARRVPLSARMCLTFTVPVPVLGSVPVPDHRCRYRHRYR